MRNLLTETTKKEIQKEYQLRVLITALVFASLAALIGAIALFPSYITSQTRKASVEQQLQLQARSNIESEGNAGLVIRTTNTQLDILTEVGEGVPFSAQLQKIVDMKPEGVALYSFVYRVSDEEGGRLQLEGSAATRDALLAFERVLNEDPAIGNVELPVSNLAKDRDIPFSISLETMF